MINNQQSPSALLKNIRIIHFAVLAGLAIFTVVAIFIRNNSVPALTREQMEMFKYISLIFLLTMLPLGYWLHNKKMKKLAGNPDLTFKLMSFKTSHLIKIALFELAGFMSILVLFFCGDNKILFQIAVIFIVILLNLPSVSKLENELNLTPAEKDQF